MILSSFPGIVVQVLAEEDVLTPSYNWTPQFYGMIEGDSKLLYTRSFARSQLRFVDIDNDGDDDLFVGKADGRIAFFINQGDFSDPLFKLQTEDFVVIHEGLDKQNNPTLLETVLDVGNNAAPEFADIDDDGDFDLFIGSKDGHIFHYENRGNQLSPVFFRETPIYMGLKFEGNSVPRFADLNGDRALDLLIGTDGRKMSKSYNNSIDLFSSEKTLQKSINKIKTDSKEPGEKKETKDSIIFQYFDHFSDEEEINEIKKEFEDGIGWGDAKKKLFSKINQEILPLRDKYFELIDNPKLIEDTLEAGETKARDEANKNLEQIKEKIGI